MNYQFISSLIIVSLLSMGVQAATIDSIASGMPTVAKEIGEHSFVPVELERLAHAKVWYVDYAWHRAQGIDVPRDGLRSKEFREQILNAYAWQSRTETDTAENFTGEKKTAYADYYGGEGAGSNHGSGRAAAFGRVQIKGVKTSMAKDTDPWHSNGAVQSIEAVDEAIWGQLLDGEFQQGSNRIVAVILTGTYGKMESGQVFPRALIVREMAVRPAHYMLSPARQYWSTPGDGPKDTERVKKSLTGLLSSLPYPDHFQTNDLAEKARVGFLTLIDLEAHAQAEYISHRLFFGSYSPSNMEITGRRLDLGDHTAQDGYTPIYRVEHLSETPFGEIGYFSKLFNEMRKSLMKTLDSSISAQLPTAHEVEVEFKTRFEFHRAVEFVRLTGVPDEILVLMQHDPSVQNLGSAINELTRVGHPEKPVFTNPDGWQNTSLYDVNAMLSALAGVRAADAPSALDIVSRFVSDRELAASFASKYAGFIASAQKTSAGKISNAALATFMKEAAVRRNINRPDLVRGHRRWKELWNTTDHAIAAGENEPTLIQDYIESRVANNLSDVKDAAPYTVVISEKDDTAAGVSVRRIFDAKAYQYATVVKITMTNGRGTFNGIEFMAGDIKSRWLNLKTADGISHLARPSVSGDAVTFRVAGISPEAVANARVYPLVKKLVLEKLEAKTCEALFK